MAPHLLRDNDVAEGVARPPAGGLCVPPQGGFSEDTNLRVLSVFSPPPLFPARILFPPRPPIPRCADHRPRWRAQLLPWFRPGRLVPLADRVRPDRAGHRPQRTSGPVPGELADFSPDPKSRRSARIPRLTGRASCDVRRARPGQTAISPARSWNPDARRRPALKGRAELTEAH
jgi:hypothetical protein